MKISLRLAALLIGIFCTAVFGNSVLGQPGRTSWPTSREQISGHNLDTALVLIRFDYKQSALFHEYTKEVIDSIAALLLKDTAIRISIDGYAHELEGSDTINYYISLNRALFVKDYILGRGIDSSRILWVKGLGSRFPRYKGRDEKGMTLNCRAEIFLFIPERKRTSRPDRDGDGFADDEDSCPDVYGHIETNGCPDTAIQVPFGEMNTGLIPKAYDVMDSVVRILKENPTYTLSIVGHAFPDEGNNTVCERLAINRATIVNAYLQTRYIAASRVDVVKSMGTNRPVSAGRNPKEISQNARAEIYLHKHD